MSDRASIPLVLRVPGPGRLVFALPRWYPAAMGAILALLVAGLADAGRAPGPLAWLLLALVVLGILYEESWCFDAARGRLVHRVGLRFAARTEVIPLAAIDRFLIAPHVEGTIPGTEDERAENAAALKGGRGDDGAARRFRHKKPYLGLVLECADGTHFLVDRVPARSAARLRETGARMAEFCARPLTESGA